MNIENLTINGVAQNMTTYDAWSTTSLLHFSCGTPSLCTSMNTVSTLQGATTFNFTIVTHYPNNQNITTVWLTLNMLCSEANVAFDVTTYNGTTDFTLNYGYFHLWQGQTGPNATHPEPNVVAVPAFSGPFPGCIETATY